jgi:hypothetical protein
MCQTLVNLRRLTLSDFISYRALWSAVIVAIFLSIATGIMLCAGVAQTGQSTEILGSQFSFGYVPYGTLLRYHVQFVNHTDSLLRVVRVAPGCGCTKIPIPEKVAAPGETLTVEIQLDLAKLNKGEFVKTPAVLLSDPALGKVSIRLSGFSYIQGDIAAQVRVTPDRIILKKRSQAETVIEIHNLSAGAIQARPVLMPSQSLCSVVMPTKPIAKGATEKIRVRANPAGKDSEAEDYLTFYLTDDKMTRFTVPITLAK